MEKIENISRDELIKRISSFIKNEYNNIGNKTNVELPIFHSNWMNGLKRWSHSEIKFGGICYSFNDKEIDEYSFITILNKALETSGIKGKVFFDEYGDGFWSKKVAIFRRLEIFGKPCKEFNELNKILSKYGSKEVGEFDVFHVRVCGKRSTYSESGDYHYLCHDKNACLSIIEYIKANKGRNGIVSIEVKEYLDHGDDYDIAMRTESEWYGSMGNSLKVTIKGGKGKKDYQKEFDL